MSDLIFEPMYIVAGMLRRREVSSADLVEAALAQIERYQDRLNPLITQTAERARATARDRDAEFAAGLDRGPLHGIPLVLKDLFDTAGVRTTGGSAVYRDRIPEEDAAVVRLLREAGAVSLGKTGMPEFAEEPTSTNPTYGAVRNPWNPDLDTAGSSSGTAAAIASGMAWVGPGSDTGGSIRMPSAACGLVGLKPTYGRVSLKGVLPLAASLDHVGPMARTVRDAALLLQAIAGFDPADPLSRDAPVPPYAATLDDGISGLRVAYFSDDGGDPVPQDIQTAFQSGLRTLEAAGASLSPVDLSYMKELNEDGALYLAEVYEHYSQLLDEHAGELSPYVRDVLERGQKVTGAEVMAERRSRDAKLHRVERALAGFDLAVSPTLALHPPPAGGIDLALIRFTSVWDQNGWPAITVPVDVSPVNGLPIGFQIIARPWQEALLLQAARVIERSHALAFPPPAL
jgi:aspartyl-tRNA(Asn)/glutamyl-tRNA(Gln) amidotransferase subunit A